MSPGNIFKRLMAFIIDSIIITIPLTVYNTIVVLRSIDIKEASQLSTQALMEKSISAGFPLIVIITTALYYMVFECSKWQASIGKRLLGLCVLNKSNDTLKIWQSLLRTLLWHLPSVIKSILVLFMPLTEITAFAVLGLSFVLACFIPIFFTRDKLTLYDMLTNTRVCEKLNKNRLR